MEPTKQLVLTKKYRKLMAALRWRLQGEKFHTALACLNLAEQYSLGIASKSGIVKEEAYDIQFRKDGVTPEFEHQIRIALLAFILKDVPDLEALICVILLHDLMEDYDVERQLILDTLTQWTGPDSKNKAWARKVYNAVWAMTKTYRGVKKSMEQVLADIADDALASLAKGLDRVQNFQSMIRVFKLAKRKAYILEGIDWFLPMLKKARKKFSYQMDAYLCIETLMKYQIELFQVINDTDLVNALNSEGVSK